MRGNVPGAVAVFALRSGMFLTMKVVKNLFVSSRTKDAREKNVCPMRGGNSQSKNGV
jgi:hypothetical protein